ncbi:MAG: type VI secretion system baseplate subunit TssG, partial [Polyangiales bacterium]
MSPTSVPVGGAGPASEEAIRFAHDPSLTFHAGDVSRIEPRVVRHERVFARITTTFLGLTGSASPLAAHMTESVLRAEANDEPAVREFYDLFHHRVLSLLFRAWKKYRFHAGYRSDATDDFTRRALCLVGVDVAGAVSRQALPPGDMLGLSRVASQRTRPSWMLQLVLERIFPGATVAIES